MDLFNPDEMMVKPVARDLAPAPAPASVQLGTIREQGEETLSQLAKLIELTEDHAAAPTWGAPDPVREAQQLERSQRSEALNHAVHLITDMRDRLEIMPGANLDDMVLAVADKFRAFLAVEAK